MLLFYTQLYTAPSGMGFSVNKGDIAMDIATEIPESDDVLALLLLRMSIILNSPVMDLLIIF